MPKLMPKGLVLKLGAATTVDTLDLKDVHVSLGGLRGFELALPP
jgi:hypothetical protein